MTREILDVLMVTHKRAEYTRRSLRRLLDTADDALRVWVWHNGDDRETLEVVESFEPHLHAVHVSPDNRLLRDPINWFFYQADGDLLGLVNDDCLVTDGWADTLRRAHRDVPRLGVVACWHFPREDFDPELAGHKIRELDGGHRIMVHPWVQGSGVVAKRRCVRDTGPLLPGERGFTPWCVRAANRGWTHGWHVPLVLIDHMDDPRSPNTLLRTDDDLRRYAPLSAGVRGTHTVEDWVAHLQRSARTLQTAPADPRQYVGWRKKLRRTWARVRRRELMY